MPRRQDTLFALPKFEGRSPDGQTIKISGTMALPVEMQQPHHLDDIVYLVLACKTSKVSHDVDGNTKVMRVETLSGARMAILEGTEGEKLLSSKFAAAGVTFDI